VSGSIPAGTYVLGWALLALTVGVSAAVAMITVRRTLGHLTGVPRVVALALLTISVLLLVHLVPLMLGVLTRATAPITALIALAAAHKLIPAQDPLSREQPGVRTERQGAVSSVLAGAGVLLLVAYSLAFLHAFATVHPASTDALNFHLPGVIRFIQSGTLWQTTAYIPGWAFGSYPQYGDLLLLAVVLPWHSLALVRYVDPVLLGVAAVSVYGIARELRAPASTAALCACAVVAIKPALSPALVEVMTDPTFLAAFAAGTLFLVRHWRTGQRSDLALAGLGLGIALGTKWYGMTDVPALVAVWVLAGLLWRRGPRRVASDAGVLIGTIAVAGGIWLVRNLILTGNPVFDVKVRVLGVTIFDAPFSAVRATGGFSIAHYLRTPHVLRTFVWPVWRGDFGVAGALLAAGAGIGLILALAELRRRKQAAPPAAAVGAPPAATPVVTASVAPMAVLLAIAALLVAIAYVVTPYSAMGPRGLPLEVGSNTRYGVPALLLAAPVLAWVGGRFGRAGIAVDALLLGVIAVSLHRHLAVGLGQVLVAAVVLAVLAAAAVAWRRGWRPRAFRAARPPSRRAAASAALGAAAVLGCGVVALLYHYQRGFARARYSPDDPAVEYALAHAPAGARIGLTGVWSVNGLIPVAPLFGPRLQNHVVYVGHFVDHMLRQYDSPQQFVSALRRGHLTLLMIGTGSPPSARPPQELLARQAGFVPVARSARLVLLAPKV
jgi:hypothetical protein